MSAASYFRTYVLILKDFRQKLLKIGFVLIFMAPKAVNVKNILILLAILGK